MSTFIPKIARCLWMISHGNYRERPGSSPLAVPLTRSGRATLSATSRKWPTMPVRWFSWTLCIMRPHALIDVEDWGCDFVVCSAYKFFGPHIGILWGRRELLEKLPAYKVRPCPETLPDRWMTGTQNFACIAGVGAAVDYLASLGEGPTRRAKLQSAFAKIENYERALGARLLAGLATLPSVKIWGITDPKRFHERVPTVSFTHRKHKPQAIAEFLSERGIFVWHGNYYALPLTERLGLEPDGMVRVGLLHYNTAEEVDRLISALREIE